MDNKPICNWKDKTLFTPGPLITSRLVKLAMLRDLGARDTEFLESIEFIHNRLLELAGVQKGEYETILMQGSGTYGLESVVASTIPPDGKFLVLANGAYGHRIVKMSKYLKIDTLVLAYAENVAPKAEDVKKALEEDDKITHVGMVHCETTSGIENSIDDIGKVVNDAGRIFFVDAMSSFGAYPINMKDLGIHYMVSSANKCIEGVPGFTYVLAKRDTLEATEGYARSLSLDILDQLKWWEAQGQFRYTPPTQSLLAFKQALVELEEEGGVEGRATRYQNNFNVLVQGMREIGFKEYVDPKLQSYIITSFLFPEDPNFDGHDFYNRLSDKNQIIYSGKVTDKSCFRIGNIGRLDEHDIRTLLAMIRIVLDDMGIKMS